MKKNILLCILAIFIFAVIICFNIKNKKYEESNVIFWTLQLSSYDKYINKIIDNFEKENPDIKIKWIDVPYSEGEKRTLAAILTDNPPDIINTTPDFTIKLAQKNALQNINMENLNQFIPSISEVLKYKNEYFGIPFYATSAITLCNTEITDIKKYPKTYEDLFKILPKTKTYLTMINFTENDTLLKLLNKYNINSPQTVNSKKCADIYKEFKRLYDENIIPKESITQTHRDALEKYMSGQLAFLVTGGNFLNMIKENSPTVYKKTVVLPQLTGDTGLYDYSLMNFIIPKKAKNKKSALKFALFLTNEVNQLELSKLTPVLPVNKSAINNEYFKYTNGDLQSQARVISARQLERLQPPLVIKNKKELNTISSNYIQEILINNAPINETLSNFANDWAKLELEK